MHSVPPLNYDIWFELFDFTPFPTLSALRSICHFLRFAVKQYLQIKWHHCLCKYVTDPVAFRNTLRFTRSVVSGSLALQFSLHAVDGADWDANDMDHYCPLSSAETVHRYLEENEHYRVIPRSSTAVDEPPSPSPPCMPIKEA
ncbi:hypothetical protein FA95DRAFT_1613607 [Auriscalpium vulgare]|uniref:Uncharacterized protein n=1 Tax=Auriscalpium vulgare TaxID=40419 RepID=A0ACB8R2A7_9AGAM|nr:hypothetical protein FA95DRAFT_1613607 [Auriscalpium vulgare]